jgi:hypothetical protein
MMSMKENHLSTPSRIVHNDVVHDQHDASQSGQTGAALNQR